MVTCKMPLVLIMRTSLAATMCAIGRKIFHHSLEKISRAINTGTRTSAIFAEAIDNLGLKQSRSAAAERPTPLRMHSRNVQLPQSIDDARRALVRALHHRLDLRAGARRVEPKPHLFAFRQKLRIHHGGGERLAQRG